MYYQSVHVKTEYYTHIMKYMGSKRELLGEIRNIAKDHLDGEKAFLDLFAGTCGVGMALRDLAPIYSNDIQGYSSAIAQGCLSVNLLPLSTKEIFMELEADFNHNYNHVAALVPGLLSRSNGYKKTILWDDDSRLEYIAFADNIAAHVLEKPIEDNKELAYLRKEYKKRITDTRAFPYIQTTYLFSEMYFSLEQAIIIDSLRYAIDKLEEHNPTLAKALMPALIHAYSYCSAGTGHFAQFRDLSTMASIKDVFSYRNRSVLEYFLRKAEEVIVSTHNNQFAIDNKSFSSDYTSLLSNRALLDKVGLIYADPPYSFVHYSRFYHAIENLCRYDYPSVEHKGRYRKDRHQSPFCIKTKAPGAFDDLFRLSRQKDVPLLVSYSNTGMISLETLENIAKANGYNVGALEIDHKHSTMGRLKDKNRNVKEALLLCVVN